MHVTLLLDFSIKCFFFHFERKLITTITTWWKPVNMEAFFTMYFYSKFLHVVPILEHLGL